MSRQQARLRKEIRSILTDEFGAVLDDIAWRIRTLTEHAGKVSAEQLNISQHILTGYTVTPNSPTAGSIAWADLYVVYKGTQYGPFGANTAMTYVWFDADHATMKIQTSNTKPTLTADDAILFVNNGGAVVEVLKSQLVSGKLLIDGSVNSGELADAAITAGKIFDGAVTVNKIGAGAVTDTKIATDAVTDVKIAAGAVTETKLGTAAVTTAKIAANAVTNAEIANGAVGGAKISSGGVDTSKLNLLQHLIF